MSKITTDLVKIPTKYIISDQEFNVDLIKVLGLSKVYSSNTDDLNIIPITVVPKEDGYYSLVTGYEIYQALKEAGKEWALALRINDNQQSISTWKYELNDERIKLNICELDSNEFQAIFEYLQGNIKQFSTIKVDSLVEKVSDDPMRIYWSSLDLLTELRCGITKAKLPLLNEYLYASPDLSRLTPITSIVINSSTEDEISDQLQRLKIEPDAGKLRKIDSVSTARKIVADEDRIYWSSSKHLVKAKVGITTALWSLLKAGFTFEPAPTPVPNTSKFLLSQLGVTELRNEAKARNLDTKGLKKGELVEQLSSR